MLLYEELSNKIVGAFFSMHNELGPGVIESCYHNALYFELKELGLSVAYNAPFNVFYKGYRVGSTMSSTLLRSQPGLNRIYRVIVI